MENTEGNGGPQADDGGERELFVNLRKIYISTDDTDGCPQADGGGEREVPGINRKLKKIILV